MDYNCHLSRFDKRNVFFMNDNDLVPRNGSNFVSVCSQLINKTEIIIKLNMRIYMYRIVWKNMYIANDADITRLYLLHSCCSSLAIVRVEKEQGWEKCKYKVFQGIR